MQEQLTKELQRLRRQIAELEKSEAEHKKIEEKLQESKARYQALFDRTLYCVYVHDFEGRFLDANDAAFDLLGYTRKEVSSLTLAEVFDQDQLATALKRVKEIKRTGFEKEPMEYRLKKRGSGYVWVEVESFLIYRGGKPYAIQGIARDITERKLAEEALQESELQYRTTLNSMGDAIHVVDKNLRFVLFNDAFKQWNEELGLETDVIGRTVFEVFPFLPDKVRDEYRHVFETGEMLVTEEHTTIDKGQFITESRKIPIFESGRVTRVATVIRNITDRKRAEEALKRSYDQLRETFIATVNALASTVEMKDPYTAGHQRWATRLACAIAKEMDLSEERIEGIRMAGLIHDIGKINIPAEILSKPGHLSEIQYSMVKIHPQVGCDILREIKFPWPVAEIVQQHHERMNGSGYPEGRSGEEIILEARILAVADAVEAMSSHRPYRAAHGIDRALEEISQHRGTLYDPEVVDACLRLFEKGFRFD